MKLMLYLLYLSLFVSSALPPLHQPMATAKLAPSRPAESQAKLTLTLEEDAARINTPVELTITGVPTVTNPFDATEADLRIQLVDPTGATISVGGFWYQEYAPDGLQPQGDAGWRARFTPTVSGEWRATATFQPSGLASNEAHFVVSKSTAPGFIHIDPDNPRFFAYDNGTRFLAFGVNMSWWDDDPIENYTRWLDHFAENGGNTIRVWMANWAFALEWKDTKLGDYRPRMRQAWLLDELFRLADERGVKIILVLNHHGQFSRTVNPQWDENPYNAELGGPLNAPEEFVSDATAIALFQRRLRYIVDRWGAAPNLLAWEWWNEYNYTPIDDSEMADWVVQMDAFLTTRDPYDHLVTISGPANAKSPIWQLPSIDFVSLHTYTTIDPLHVAGIFTREYAPVVQETPLLLAEYGFSAGEETVDSLDKSGIHLHNGLWATIFRRQAGTGMYWWWDTYLEPLGLWQHFLPLSRFLKGVDPAAYASTSAHVSAADGNATQALGLVLWGEDQHLLWVRSNHYTAAAATEAHDKAVREALRNREILQDFVYTPPPIEGHSVEINYVEGEKYAVHWFDPQTGQWGAVEEIEAVDGTLTIPLPTFAKDIAAKIEAIR